MACLTNEQRVGFDRSLDLFVMVDLDELLDWVRDNLIPTQVFDADKLAAWADANGYVLAEPIRARR